MSATFGHRWTSAYGEDPRAVAGRVWAAELAGMTRDQIDAGLAACRAGSDSWPPSLPGFKAACLQIPSMAIVRADIDQLARWVSQHCATPMPEVAPFSMMAWQSLDAYNYRHAPTDKADKLLREAYSIATDSRMRGAELPEVKAAITHEKPKPKPAAPGVVAAALAEARELLGDRKAAAAGPDA